jgi:HAD superfamily hydrolase (TIGR01509 family)
MRRSLSDPFSIVVRAVVFDLDGLMFDTEALYHRIASELLAEKGKVFTAEIMRAMIGRRAPEAGLALKTLAGLDESVDDLLTTIRERFQSQMEVAVHPTPGLFVLLDRLKEAGHPLAVATSSQRAYAEGLLRTHGLRDRFRALLSAEDVTRGKPDPEIYLRAASALGAEPSSVIVLEDSPPGVQAARAAGAFAVGVPHDHSPAEALEAAHLIVERLDDPTLLRLISGGAHHQ